MENNNDLRAQLKAARESIEAKKNQTQAPAQKPGNPLAKFWKPTNQPAKTTTPPAEPNTFSKPAQPEAPKAGQGFSPYLKDMPAQQAAPVAQQVQAAPEKPAENVNPFMSHLNILSSRIANVPADLGEGWAIASAAIERGLGKIGFPGANKDVQASDIATYRGAESWRKMMDEVYPVNKPDRETFLGGVMDGLGQVVPLALTGGSSAMPKVALQATKAGTNLTPYINTGKEIAKRFASKEGLLAGSQIAAPSYKQAKEQGATEDQALQYAIENFAVGSVVENLPIQSMFSRIAKLEPKSPVLNILKEGAVGGSEEAVTEMWQTMYENWSADRIYNANQQIFEGIGDAGSVGGAVGFILNTATTALIGKRRRTSDPQEIEKLDESIAQLEEKKAQVEANNQQLQGNVRALEASNTLGEGIGPKSFGSTKPSNIERRKQAGRVVLGKDKNGNPIEITGAPKQQEDGSMLYPAITAGGRFVKISENDISDVVEMDFDGFGKLLEGKLENTREQELQSTQQAQNQAMQAQDAIRAQYEPLTFQNAEGAAMIGTAELNGEKVIVTNINPDGSYTIYDPKAEKKKIVGADLIQNKTVAPFEDFMASMSPVQAQAAAPQFDPQNPIQKGEVVPIDGQNYIVTGVNMEEGAVQLENENDETDFLPLTLDQFQQLRQPQAQPAAEPAQNSGASQLREIFAVPSAPAEAVSTPPPAASTPVQEPIAPSQDLNTPTANEIPAEVPPAQPESVPVQPASEEQTGLGQPAIENAPAEPVGEGVDNQVPVDPQGITDDTPSKFKTELINRGFSEEVAQSNAERLTRSLSDPEIAKQTLLPENKNLREIWSKETGVTLPKSIKGTREAIDQYFMTYDDKQLIEATKSASKVFGTLESIANATPDEIYNKVPEATPEIAKEIHSSANEKLGREKPTTPPNEPVQQTKPQPEAGQDAVQAQENQAIQPRPEEGQEKLEQGGQGVVSKKKYPRKKTPEQIRKQEIVDREPSTATGYARRWLLQGGKLNSVQSSENKEKGTGIGKGVRDETGMSGREMRSLIGIIDNKKGLSPEVAAERIHETLNEETASRISVQDLRNALIDVILSEDRKDWTNNQDNETREATLDAFDKWAIDQLSPEARAEIEAEMQSEAYWENISANSDALAKQYDEFVASEEYQQYIDDIYGQYAEGPEDGQNQPDLGEIEGEITPEKELGEDGAGADRSGQRPNPDRPDTSSKGRPEPVRAEGAGNDHGQGVLNPKGNYTQSVNAAKEAGLKGEKLEELEGKGKILSAIRRQFPQLTDQHENELFDALNSGIKPDKLAEIVFGKVNSIGFDGKSQLNFTKAAKTTDTTKRGEIERQIKGIKARTKALTDLSKKRKLNEAEKAELAAMTKEADRLNQQWGEAMGKQEASKPAEQVDMFAAPKEEIKPEPKKPITSLKELNEKLNKTGLKQTQVTFKIPEEFAETIAKAKLESAPENNRKYAVDQIKKSIKHYEGLRNTEGIDTDKLDSVIERLNSDLKEIESSQKPDKSQEKAEKQVNGGNEIDPEVLKEIRNSAIKEVNLPRAVSDFFQYLNPSNIDDHTWAMTGEGFAPRQANQVRDFFHYINAIRTDLPNKSSFVKILKDQGFDIDSVDLAKTDWNRIKFKNGLLISIVNSDKKGVENIFKQGTLISIRDTEAYRREKYPERFKDEDKQAEAKKPTQTKQEEVGVLDKEELQDVGEKIGGAKKDTWEPVKATAENIKSEPLSKVFPKPDFKKLVESGQLTEDNAIFLRYLYESIPTKPKQSWNLSRYEKQVSEAIKITNTLIGGGDKTTNMADMILKSPLKSGMSQDFAIFYQTMKKLGFPKNPAAIGNFKVVSFNSGGQTRYALQNGKKWADSKRFDDMDAAIDHLADTMEKRKDAPKYTKMDIYQDRITKDYFIGKKGAVGVVRVMEGFKSAREADTFLKENPDQIQGIWDAMSAPVEERRGENRDRIGTDWRKGENVSAEQFKNTFGFRGVEFGNWVNNKERQNSVNDAYDALMDLAGVIGVDPRALSLAGKLGFAFGARGSGKAMAHYEPGKVVINLTKTKGAGSLAHEWWHAIDNYFGAKRGYKDAFVSENPRQRMNQDGTMDQRIRKEMLDAFKAINDAIAKTEVRKRSARMDSTKQTPYWSTDVEMTARAFENYVIEKLAQSSQQNDYLANFKEMAEWIGSGGNMTENRFPYPTKEESPVVNEAYDQFFRVLQVDEASPDKAMFMKVPSDPQTETKAFKDWFGDSKVVNPDGSPMVLYHGTASDFDLFEVKKATDKEGRKKSLGWGKDKFYFTDSPVSASVAADWASQNKDRPGSNPSVMPVYLSIKNPISAEKYKSLVSKEIDGGLSRDQAISKVDKALKKDGIDGIMDEVSGGIAVFSPTQIKSATGNQGTFDPNNPDIRFSMQTGKEPNLIDLNSSRAQEMIEAPKGKPTKTATEIQAKVDEVTKDWKNAPETVVVNNAKEAQRLYPELKGYSSDEIKSVPAVFITNPRTGKKNVVLIADHSYLSEPNGVRKAILHEAVGHYGIREVILQRAGKRKEAFKTAYNKLMQQIFDSKKGERMMEDIAKRYFGKDIDSLSPMEQLIVADEYLAHVAQEGVSDSLIDRVVAKIRQLLRAVGFDMAFTNAEVRALIGNSMRIVQGPNGNVVVRDGIDPKTAPMAMIIGEQGAANLDKQEEVNYRIDNLATAREMEDAGKDTETIRLSTGWERGADGKWRYEVNDGQWKDVDDILSRVLDDKEQSFKLSDVYDNQEIYAAYPKSRGITVKIDPNPTATGYENASFNTVTDELTIYAHKIRRELGGKSTEYIRSTSKDLRGLRKLINHELTHYIQRIEGFENGSNTDFFDKFKKYNQEIIGHMDQADKEVGLDNWVQNTLSDEKLRELSSRPDFSWDTFREEYAKTLPEPKGTKYRGFIEKARAVIDKNIALAGGPKVLGLSSMEAYRRVAGEVEARNVVNRTDFTPEQRRSQTLQSTEDVAREDQIFLQDSGSQASMSVSDQTETEAFKKWFGDSKVVDSEGKPLTVYHGTTADFNTFQPRSKATDTLFEKDFENDVYFFSNSPDTASEYAESFGINGANIIPVKLSIQNPYIIDRGGKGYRPNMMSAWIKQAKDGGHDGLIVKNMRDFGQESGTQYAVFSPTQIKSATGNNGDFDGGNADIRFMIASPNPPAMPPNMKNSLYQRAKEFLLTNKEGKDRRQQLRENIQDDMLPGKKMLVKTYGSVENIPDSENFYFIQNHHQDIIVHQIKQFENRHMEPLKKLTDKMQKEYGVKFTEIDDYLMALHNQERREKILGDKIGKVKNGDFTISPKMAKKIAKDLKDKVPNIETYLVDLQSSEQDKRLKAMEKLLKEALAKTDDPFPTGMTQDDADAILKDFESKVPESDRKDVTDRIKAINKFSLDTRLEGGLLSKKGYDILDKMYENYVPLRSREDQIEEDTTIYSPLMKANGRSSKASSPIAYLSADVKDAISSAEHNKVLQSLLEYVKHNPSPKEYSIENLYLRKSLDADGNEIWSEVPEGEKPTKEELDNGTAKRGFDPELHESVKFDNKPSERTVVVAVNGQKVKIVFKKGNEQLVKAIKGSPEKLPWLMNIFSKGGRMLSKLFTSYSPEFGFVNASRDTSFAANNIIARDGMEIYQQTMAHYPKSLTQLYSYFGKGQKFDQAKDPYLKEFFAEGAFTGYAFQESVSEIHKKFSAIEKAGGILSKPVEWKDAALEYLDSHNSAIENATRLAYYKALRKAGYSKLQATQKAKSVTVNFRRKGNYTRQFGALYLFFNVAVQSIENFFTPFVGKDPKIRKRALTMATMLAAAGFVQGMAWGLFAGDDEEDENPYDNESNHTKNNNIMIWVGKDKFVKIPIGFGPNVPYAMGEMAADFILGKSTAGDNAVRFANLLLDTFSVLPGMEVDSEQGIEQQLTKTFTPGLVKPVVDVGFNTNFMGYDIYPENKWNPDKPDSESYRKNTSEVAKKIAQGLNKATGGSQFESGWADVHPDVMEYYFRQYLGGPGYFGSKVWTTAVDNAFLKKENPFSSENVSKVPFVSRFFTRTDNSRAINRNYWDAKEKIDKAVKLHKDYKKVGDTENATRVYEENKELINMDSVLSGYGSGKNKVPGYEQIIKKQRDYVEYLKQNDATDKEIRDAEEVVLESMDQFVKYYNKHRKDKPVRSVTELFKEK